MPNAIFFYRIANTLYKLHIPFLPAVFQLILFVVYGSRIPFSCNIDEGSYFVAKGMGVQMHDRTSIGKNCSIGFGAKFLGKSPYKNVPKVGDNVFISSGAVFVGPVIIGNNCIIGPNSVVTKSVPEGSIVGGIPARIIGRVSELGYDIYSGSESNDGHMSYLS